MIAWNLYFPTSECVPDDPRIPIIRALAAFLQANHETYINLVRFVIDTTRIYACHAKDWVFLAFRTKFVNIRE